MKRLIPGLVLLVLLSGTASAEIGYFCVDDNSFHNWTLDGDTHSMTEPCKFGCDDDSGMCLNEPVDNGYAVAVIIGFIGVAFIMAYLAMNVDRKQHGTIQILFIFLALYGTWASLGAVLVILEIQAVTQLLPLNTDFVTIQMWGAIFVLFYIFIMLIYNLYKHLLNWKRSRKDGLGDATEGARMGM